MFFCSSCGTKSKQADNFCRCCGTKKNKAPSNPLQLTTIQVLFSFKGRIGRYTYWTYSIITYLICLAISLVFYFNTSEILTPFLETLISTVLFIYMWSTLAVIIKRLHDRNKSGWFIFIILIPLIGLLWLHLEIGFLAGCKNCNNYGHPEK